MQDYNLTNEIKKISGAINSSSPNTELGNINGSVGNLDTAMQSVATAIGNIIIPNTGSNIDGVATAINNKTIPDPTTALGNIVSAIQNINITAVPTDSVALDGSRWNQAGNYIADLNLFWEGMGHVNTSTLNHPQSNGNGIVIAARNGAGAVQVYIPVYAYSSNTDPRFFARFTQYADLNQWANPWEEVYYNSYQVMYEDNNNIGETDVQGAIDKLSAVQTYTSTTYDSSVFSSVKAYKQGNVVTLIIAVRGGLAASTWMNDKATGLPTGWRPRIATPFSFPRITTMGDLGKVISADIGINGTVSFIEHSFNNTHTIAATYIV